MPTAQLDLLLSAVQTGEALCIPEGIDARELRKALTAPVSPGSAGRLVLSETPIGDDLDLRGATVTVKPASRPGVPCA